MTDHECSRGGGGGGGEQISGGMGDQLAKHEL